MCATTKSTPYQQLYNGINAYTVHFIVIEWVLFTRKRSLSMLSSLQHADKNGGYIGKCGLFSALLHRKKGKSVRFCRREAYGTACCTMVLSSFSLRNTLCQREMYVDTSESTLFCRCRPIGVKAPLLQQKQALWHILNLCDKSYRLW